MPLSQNSWTIKTAAEALSKNEFSSKELTEDYLERAQSKNDELNAYLTFTIDDARAAAAASDERRTRGESLSALDGIPVAVKDNLLTKGTRTTGGSNILSKYIAPYDATVIARLREAGAVIIGKTNLDEFAMGGSTEHSAYGPTKNPYDLTRVPGGSSGGSAAAVAADLCVGSLGSDTGGSIRQPAAFCGIVGFKPTYGRVSRYGAIAMASSLDQVGPMTKTAEDAALMLDIIQGHDVHDQTTRATAPLTFDRDQGLDPIKIGLPKQAWSVGGIQPGVRAALEEGMKRYERLGVEFVEVDVPYVNEALAVYYVLMPCEVSANMARFDGIRYGNRASSDRLLDVYLDSRTTGLGEEVRRRILIGAYALSKGYYDAYYVKARQVQAEIRRAYAKAFTQVDLLLTPTTPSTAFKLGEKLSDPLAMYLEDIFTVSINVAGLPAISIPCGLSEGLPVGMQLIGPQMGDDLVLTAAHAFEQLA
jgi:aspartyl-tRNA(Asn)/glutamyl-tRNA(Gln) amidotransferase subunit A